MTVSTLTPSGVQCPKCGAHSIVEYKPTVYHCLKCGFEKDLSIPPKPEGAGLGEVIMGLAGFGLGLLILL